jgi:hypothetical protein
MPRRHSFCTHGQPTGIRKRPLLGGLDAWQERNYPTELHMVGRASPWGVTSDNQEHRPLIQIPVISEIESTQTRGRSIELKETVGFATVAKGRTHPFETAVNS